MIFVIGLIIVAVLSLAMLAFKLYVVVEPNKAHVVVTMGGGRKIYHPADKNSRSAYFYIPGLMQRIIVSLENVKHEINNIVLHDKNVAPFQCDITCWFKIVDSSVAAEKLDVDENGNIMDSIRETLNAQVQGVARNAAMQQEILDLMRDRMSFGESVFNTVNGDLDEWGVQLVKLEIIDFADADGGHVIQDYEKRREAEINSTTRQVVAKQEQVARVTEAEALKISEQAKIDANQIIEMRNIEKEQIVGVRQQEARLKVAVQADLANAKEVAAQKTKVLGEANYTAEATVIQADGVAKAQVKTSEGQASADIALAKGRAQAVEVEANATASAIEVQGTAEAEVVRQKGTAEADATSKKAEAQKKFTDASKEIELAKIVADIEKTKYVSLGDAVSKANVHIVSPDMNFMGFDAKDGAGLGSLVDTFQKSSGVNLAKVITSILPKAKEEKPQE